MSTAAVMPTNVYTIGDDNDGGLCVLPGNSALLKTRVRRQRPSRYRNRPTRSISSKILLNGSNKHTSRHHPTRNRRFRPHTIFHRYTTQRNSNRTNQTLTISKKTSIRQDINFPSRLRRNRNSITTTRLFRHKTSIRTIKRRRVRSRTRNRTKRRRRARLIVTNNIRPPRRYHSTHRRRRPTAMKGSRPLIRKSRVIRQTISSVIQINSNRIRPRRPSRMRRPMRLVPRIKPYTGGEEFRKRLLVFVVQ